MAAKKQPAKRAEESETRFRVLADAAPVMIWMSGTDKQCTWFNKAWLDFTGRPIEQELGDGWVENVHTDDRDTCLKTYSDAFDSRKSFSMEYRLKRHDGRYRWLLDNGAPLFEPDGEFAGYIGSCVDITECRGAEEVAAAAYRRLQFAMSAGKMAAWTWDPHQDVATSTENFQEILGQSIINNLEQGLALVHPEDRGRHRQTVENAVKMGAPYHSVFRIVRPDNGQVVWLDERAVPVTDNDGRFMALSGVVVDITERRQAEESVAAAYRHLKLAMSAGKMSAWTWDFQKNVVTTAENLQERFGLPSINSSEDGTALIHPDDRSRHVEIVNNALKHGTPYESVFRIVRPDNGQVVWLDVRAVPVTDSNGRVTNLSGIAIDITERKRAEQDLLASEERLRAILDTAMDAIIIIDQRGIIQSVNAAAERMFGYIAAEMIGHKVNMIMPSPYQEMHDGFLAKYLQTGEKHIIGNLREVDARRKDGTLFPTDLAVSEIKHLKLFTGIVRDLTERKQLERDVVEVASLEQRRIGQDLHDTVAQELIALNLLAKDLAETVGTDPAKAPKLAERMQQGLLRCQQELRAILRGLLPVAVESEGLMVALEDLTERTQKEGKVNCTFDCPATVSVADNVTATQLYLIAQEAVYNAVKHAQAGKVVVALNANGGLTLSVQDDGIGMPPTPVDKHGLGLRIMQDRAAIIGATLTIAPATPKGTMVTCVFSRKDHEPS
jgi:PAS domain S-box-containing protein